MCSRSEKEEEGEKEKPWPDRKFHEISQKIKVHQRTLVSSKNDNHSDLRRYMLSRELCIGWARRNGLVGEENLELTSKSAA